MKKLFVLLSSIMFCLLLTGCTKSIKPMDSVSVNFSGVEGYGKATVSIDMNELYNEIYEAMSANKFTTDEIRTFFYYTDDAQFRYELDKSDGLKNGDKVKVKLSWNNENLKKYKLKFKGSTEKEFKVEGLKEATIIDPFNESIFNVTDDTKGIHITISGVSPLLRVSINNDCDKRSPESYLRYSIKNDGYFENGDEVTITASYGYSESDVFEIDDNAYALIRTEYTLKISDQDQYLTSFDQINNQSMNDLETIFTSFRDDYFRAGSNNYISIKVNNTYDDPYVGKSNSIENMEYVKAYLRTLKDGYNYEDQSRLANRMIVIFKFDANGAYYWLERDREDYKDVYGAIYINNPVVDKDGNVLAKESDIEYAHSCFQSVEEMEKYIVLLEKYKVEEMELGGWN